MRGEMGGVVPGRTAAARSSSDESNERHENTAQRGTECPEGTGPEKRGQRATTK